MPFTSRGREYSGIEVGLASGMIRPGSGRLRRLRRDLAKEAIQANKSRRSRARQMSTAAPRRPPKASPPKTSPIELERRRRRLARMEQNKK